VRDALVQCIASNGNDDLYDTDDDDYLVTEILHDPNDKATTSNYYKKEIKEVQKRNAEACDLDDSATGTSGSQSGEHQDMDDNSSMMDHVVNHQNCMKPKLSKNTMCSTRAAMKSMAYRSQVQQAKKINEGCVMDDSYKQVLDVNDIGVVYVQPKTRNTCDHPYLPIMVAACISYENSTTVIYKLCCKYGPLRGTYAREMIHFKEQLTPELVQINPAAPDFERKAFTVEEASAEHNILGGKAFCRCKKDCVLVQKCSCMALGRLCRDKCHGGKKTSHLSKCSNCMHSTTTPTVDKAVRSNRKERNIKCSRETSEVDVRSNNTERKKCRRIIT